MEWTPEEIKEHRLSRGLGYKAMGKLFGLKEPKYRLLESGELKPDNLQKEKMDDLWRKWLEPPKVEYEAYHDHSEKQKEILKELGLHRLIR